MAAWKNCRSMASSCGALVGPPASRPRYCAATSTASTPGHAAAGTQLVNCARDWL